MMADDLRRLAAFNFAGPNLPKDKTGCAAGVHFPARISIQTRHQPTRGRSPAAPDKDLATAFTQAILTEPGRAGNKKVEEPNGTETSTGLVRGWAVTGKLAPVA
jgi:hypothetical protein